MKEEKILKARVVKKDFDAQVKKIKEIGESIVEREQGSSDAETVVDVSKIRLGPTL
jgi:DNA recombination-dependent growth factor C